LAGRNITTSTGKARWDRSTICGMPRNLAYAGRAAFAKTAHTDGCPALNRTAASKVAALLGVCSVLFG
jgi:hypothetical protein